MKPCSSAVLALTLLVVPAAQAGSLESAIGRCSAQTDAGLRLACYDRIAAGLKAARPQAQATTAPAAPAAQKKEESAWYDVGSWFASRSSKPAASQTNPADFGAEDLHTPPPAAAAQAAPAAPPPSTTQTVAVRPPAAQAAKEQTQKDKSAWYDVGGWFGGTTPKPPSEQTTAADFGSENLPAPPPAPGEAAPVPLDEITVGVADVAFNFYGRFIVTLDNGQIWKQLQSDTGRAHFHRHGKNVVTISRGILGSYNLVIKGRTPAYKVKRLK